MKTVVDASAALSWLLPSQSTLAARQFLAEGDTSDLCAPFLFEWEVFNILLVRRTSGQLTVEGYARLMTQLDNYQIALGDPFDAEELIGLAVRDRVSLFDAAYLAMAIEQRAAIASRDGRLLTAAARRALQTFDLRDP